MIYYIIEDKIVNVAIEFDSNFYNYDKLNELQVEFYIANPTARIQEIINCELEVIVNTKTLEDIKQEKLNELEDTFANTVSQGYYSADFNITLALRLEDINIFSALINMLNLATRRGFSIPSVEVADINGTSFNFDTDNAELLLLAYGVYYRSLWAENIRKSNIINSETDLVKLMDMDINLI